MDKELAERLGVHFTLIAHIRAGRRQVSKKMLGRILREFPELTQDVMALLVTQEVMASLRGDADARPKGRKREG